MALTLWYGQPAHLLPGRLRVQVPGLRSSPAMAGRLCRALGAVVGIRGVSACPVTGNVLLRFDPDRVAPERLARLLGLLPRPAAPPAPACPDERQARRQLLLATGALLFTWFRRAQHGPSPLSQSMRSWDLAGLVTVVAGYPYIRRGFTRLAGRRELSGDLILAAASLGSLLMRENLIGLSVLCLHSLTQWLFARAASRGGCGELHDARVAARHSRWAERWGLIALLVALGAGLVTGHWRRALAALIAAAPSAAGLAAPLPAAAAAVAAAHERTPDLGLHRRRALAAAGQNLLAASALNAAGLGLAAAGAIAPLGASLWHNLTTYAVVANSLRLLPRRCRVPPAL